MGPLNAPLAIAQDAGQTPERLAAVELRELDAYLSGLEAGQPGAAVAVERFAETPWPGLRQMMERYAALPEPTAPATHRAFQALLERSSRSALAPWPLLTLYSPELGEFVSQSPEKNKLAPALLKQLLASDMTRRPGELAVRLAPTASLDRLAAGQVTGRIELLEAWNRRRALGIETRPLPKLGGRLAAVAKTITGQSEPQLLAAELRFLACWPQLATDYRAHLGAALASKRADVIAAALAVQREYPLLLERNAELLTRFPDDGAVAEAALRNFAYDEAHDHSAALRGIWKTLPASDVKRRYACLFSMGLHPQGNAELALEAIRQESFDLFDVAVPLLTHAPRDVAQDAIAHVLRQTRRGHEEALRLAFELHMADFVDDAVAIVLDGKRDQVLRQAALRYLQLADGRVRGKLVSFLTHDNSDLRLSAIQMFREPRGLADDDFKILGPALVHVALEDESQGHRQEAIYVLGLWKKKSAAEVFRKLLMDYPAVKMLEGHYDDDQYWEYRLRLVSLLGLARLGEPMARQEIADLHRSGGPTERMDALLTYHELGEAPEVAFEDLQSIEPKLAATAALVLSEHGSDAQKKRLHAYFQRTPIWKLFEQSGIDDHNLLRYGGGKN